MSNVLIIEDDEILNAGLCYHLQKVGITAEPAYTLSEAKDAIKLNQIDLILIDINLPDGNGFEFAKIVLTKMNIPFIFLTAHNLDDEIINGLRLGADDYITKPFNIRIVVEKIQAILRRCNTKRKSMEYRYGNLTVNFDTRIVKKNQETLDLTPTEYSLLEFFCKNKNRILTKDILLEHIWDQKGNFVNDHTLTLNISRLRAKIEDSKYRYIKTVYGMGYQWIEVENE